MRSTATATVLSILIAATDVAAHSVPNDPSVVTCTTIAFVDPASGAPLLTVSGTEPFRSTYDRSASRVQFCDADGTFPQTRCAAGVVSRAVTDGGGAPWGVLGFPAVFVLGFSTSGDLTAVAPISLALTPTAGVAQAVPVALTTGLVGVANHVVGGRPLDETGAFTLVGSADLSSLPGGSAGAAALTMRCQAAPPPDRDQFTISGRLGRVGGKLAPGVLTLHAQVRSRTELVPDFAATPTLVELRTEAGVLATVDIPAGLAGAGRRLSGASVDETATVGLKIVARKPSGTYAFTMRAAPSAPLPSSGTADVEITVRAGGLLWRGMGTLRVRQGS